MQHCGGYSARALQTKLQPTGQQAGRLHTYSSSSSATTHGFEKQKRKGPTLTFSHTHKHKSDKVESYGRCLSVNPAEKKEEM